MIVAKMTASGDPMKLLHRSMGLGVRSVGGVSGTNRREQESLVIEIGEDVIRRHGGEEGSLGLGGGGRQSWRWRIKNFNCIKTLN